MAFNNIISATHFEEDVTFGSSVTLPANTISNDNVKSTDPIDAEKVESRFSLRYVQDEGSALVSADEMIHVCRFAGEVVDIDASFGSIIPTAAGETISVVVVKQTGATSDDVMTAPIVLDTSNVVYTPEGQAGLDGAGKLFVAGDILRVVATKAGTPVVARGLIVNLAINEASL